MGRPKSIYLKKIRVFWTCFAITSIINIAVMDALRENIFPIPRSVSLLFSWIFFAIFIGWIISMFVVLPRYVKKGEEEYALHYFGTTNIEFQNKIVTDLRSEVLELSGEPFLPENIEKMYSTAGRTYHNIAKLNIIQKELERHHAKTS